MITEEESDEDGELRVKLEQSFRTYDIGKKDSVYLMPSYYYWNEFGKAVTNVGATPVFVDLENEVLELAHKRFSNSRCILHDITYPLTPLPEEKIHWVLIRAPNYIFRLITRGKHNIPIPGVSLALKSHKGYVGKLYISDLMNQKAADEWRKDMDPTILSLYPLDYEETTKLLNVCGYRIIDVNPLISKIYDDRRFIVAGPAE